MYFKNILLYTHREEGNGDDFQPLTVREEVKVSVVSDCVVGSVEAIQRMLTFSDIGHLADIHA